MIALHNLHSIKNMGPGVGMTNERKPASRGNKKRRKGGAKSSRPARKSLTSAPQQNADIDAAGQAQLDQQAADTLPAPPMVLPPEAGAGSTQKPRGTPIDQDRLNEIISKIRRGKGRFDLVERCNLLGVPLTTRKAGDRERVFYAALAELIVAYGENSHTTSKLVKAYFGRATIEEHYRFGDLFNLTYRTVYTPRAKDLTIAMAYPWCNPSIYMGLLRVNAEQRLDVQHYASRKRSANRSSSGELAGCEGKYRYFRAYPVNERAFVLRDGYLNVEIDTSTNMICFGHASQNWKNGSFEDGEYEHRGLVIPGDFKTDLISFREGLTRFASIAGQLGGSKKAYEGIVMTATRGLVRGRKRPFIAQVLLFKEGHDLYKINIPKSRTDDAFDTDNENYRAVQSYFKKVFAATVDEANGFMWGVSESAADAAVKAADDDGKS